MTSRDGYGWDVLPGGVPCNSCRLVFGNNPYLLSEVGSLIQTSADLMLWDSVAPVAGEEGTYTTMAAYGNGILIVAGFSNGMADSGSAWMLTRQDGSDWIRTCPDSAICCLLDCQFVNGQFVAVGAEFGKGGVLHGVAMTSTDGMLWTRRSREVTGQVRELWTLAYGNGRFVAVGYKGGCIVSEDGITWTLGNTEEIPFSSYPISIAFGNGCFITGSRNTLYASADGMKWSPVYTSDSLNCSKVVFGNGRFIVSGNRGGSLLVSTGVNGQVALAVPPQLGTAGYDIRVRNGLLRIDVPAGCTRRTTAVRIFTVTGRCVLAASCGGPMTIPVRHLPQGRYIVSADTDGQTLQRNFLIVR